VGGVWYDVEEDGAHQREKVQYRKGEDVKLVKEEGKY
jgi:hypothetical protein